MHFRLRAGLRLVALSLAAAICVDVAVDAACDPMCLSAPDSTTVIDDAGWGGPIHAYAGFCVPDCFCCSRSETAVAGLTVPPLVHVAEAPEQGPDSVTAVVRPVPEPPPLAIS